MKLYASIIFTCLSDFVKISRMQVQVCRLACTCANASVKGIDYVALVRARNMDTARHEYADTTNLKHSAYVYMDMS